jgi:hypothetical protein
MSAGLPLFPVHWHLGEPGLLFHPERPDDTHVHPLLGLVQYGPYSRSLVNCVIDPIRVAVIAPQKDVSKVTHLLSELEQVHQPRERKQYLPKFPGFSRIFGVRVVIASIDTQIILPEQLEQKITSSKRPHLVLAEHLAGVLSGLHAIRTT